MATVAFLQQTTMTMTLNEQTTRFMKTRDGVGKDVLVIILLSIAKLTGYRSF